MSIASAKTETSVKTEHGSATKIQDLAKVKCIGPEFATTPVGEEFYVSFDNCGQLCRSDAAHSQSGSMCCDQGVSKPGNAKARTVMIELA